MAWASTNKTYLNRILGKQKQATRKMSSYDLIKLTGISVATS